MYCIDKNFGGKKFGKIIDSSHWQKNLVDSVISS